MEQRRGGVCTTGASLKDRFTEGKTGDQQDGSLSKREESVKKDTWAWKICELDGAQVRQGAKDSTWELAHKLRMARETGRAAE